MYQTLKGLCQLTQHLSKALKLASMLLPNQRIEAPAMGSLTLSNATDANLNCVFAKTITVKFFILDCKKPTDGELVTRLAQKQMK